MSEDLFIPWLLHRATIGVIGRVGPCPDCQPQAASDRTLVLLWFCLLSRGFASDHAADGPRASPPAAHDIAGGPTTAAPGGRAGPARGKQRPVVSNLDSGPQTQIAHRGRSPPLHLQGDQTGRVDRTHSRTCRSKQQGRGGLSASRCSPRLRAQATSLGRASLGRRASAHCDRREDQSWRSFPPTRKGCARPDSRS